MMSTMRSCTIVDTIIGTYVIGSVATRLVYKMATDLLSPDVI